MSEFKINPIVILSIGEMSKRDIKKLNDNGICVVEAKDPSKVRFADPPPHDYSVQERAAIDLFRVMMSKTAFSINRADFAALYVDIIMRGMPPQRVEQVSRAKA